MKVLGMGDKAALGDKHALDRNAGLILGVALMRQFCYLVEFGLEDYAVTLINSAADERILERSNYLSLIEIIHQIIKNRDFLRRERLDGGLNGRRVAYYLEHWGKETPDIGDCFILDRDSFHDMNPRGQYYVIDGMHRLVAYGLATNMDQRHFPVQVYYCTDRRHSMLRLPPPFFLPPIILWLTSTSIV